MYGAYIGLIRAEAMFIYMIIPLGPFLTKLLFNKLISLELPEKLACWTYSIKWFNYLIKLNWIKFSQ